MGGCCRRIVDASVDGHAVFKPFFVCVFQRGRFVRGFVQCVWYKIYESEPTTRLASSHCVSLPLHKFYVLSIDYHDVYYVDYERECESHNYFGDDDGHGTLLLCSNVLKNQEGQRGSSLCVVMCVTTGDGRTT